MSPAKAVPTSCSATRARPPPSPGSSYASPRPSLLLPQPPPLEHPRNHRLPSSRFSPRREISRPCYPQPAPPPALPRPLLGVAWTGLAPLAPDSNTADSTHRRFVLASPRRFRGRGCPRYSRSRSRSRSTFLSRPALITPRTHPSSARLVLPLQGTAIDVVRPHPTTASGCVRVGVGDDTSWYDGRLPELANPHPVTQSSASTSTSTSTSIRRTHAS